jgi:hypothetical protein
MSAFKPESKVFEGTLRNLVKLWDDHLRHMVMFSVMHKEWQNELESKIWLRLL